MVNVSGFVFPVMVSETEINVEVTDVTEAELISFEVPADAVTDASVLKLHPAGQESLNETLVPTAKSVAVPSVTTTFPSVVQAGDAAFAALSAEIPVPPVAFVMLTYARPCSLRAETRRCAAGRAPPDRG